MVAGGGGISIDDRRDHRCCDAGRVIGYVAALTTEKHVVARTAQERVIAGVASDHVVTGVARQHIVDGVARQVRRARTSQRAVGNARVEHQAREARHARGDVHRQVVHRRRRRARRIRAGLDPHRVAGARRRHRVLNARRRGRAHEAGRRGKDIIRENRDQSRGVRRPVHGIKNPIRLGESLIDRHLRPGLARERRGGGVNRDGRHGSS